MRIKQLDNLHSINYPLPTSAQPISSTDVVCYGSSYLYYRNLAESIWGNYGRGARYNSDWSNYSSVASGVIGVGGIGNNIAFVTKGGSHAYKYAHKSPKTGKVYTPEVWSRASRMGFTKIVKMGGSVVTALSGFVTIGDMIVNGTKPHHIADLIITVAFAIAVPIAPAAATVIAIGAIAYGIIDVTYYCRSGKSLTQYYFDK